MSDFTKDFFAQKLDWGLLAKIHDRMQKERIGDVEAALHLPGNGTKASPPFMLTAAIHGNEPAGIAAIYLCIELQKTGLLDAPVYCVIGNHYAAKQYFEAYRADPGARQETRDDFRMGRATDGGLMRDLNRIPRNVQELDANEHYHTRRAQQLDRLAAQSCGILDIHSARGELPCITNYSDAKYLKYSPIRIVLEGLLDSIAAHTATVTFKQLIARHPSQKHSFGIEAGRHEDPDAPKLAAEFTLALLYNLGITSATPLRTEDDGLFEAFTVGKVLKLNDLTLKGTPAGNDLFYTVKSCADAAAIPKDCDAVIVERADGSMAVSAPKNHEASGTLRYHVHQFGELEPVQKDAVVAVAVPSGATLHAPAALHTLFALKLKSLYKDPAVAIVPFTPDELDKKFGHPCTPHALRVSF